MSIAETVLDCKKLRQERHGNERCQHRCGKALNRSHGAPDGAGMVFGGSGSITMALLTELSRISSPPKTAKKRSPRSECAILAHLRPLNAYKLFQYY